MFVMGPEYTMGEVLTSISEPSGGKFEDLMTSSFTGAQEEIKPKMNTPTSLVIR